VIRDRFLFLLLIFTNVDLKESCIVYKEMVQISPFAKRGAFILKRRLNDKIEEGTVN